MLCVEAMTCGLPVVVSNIAASLDVTEHEQNGQVCTVDDPNSLAGAMALLLERPELRERLGKAARQTIESKYRLGFIADRYISLYKDVPTNSSPVNQPYLGLNPTGKKRT